jgi:hypothetical protein
VKRKRDLAWLKDLRVAGLAVTCLVAGFLIGMLVFGRPWHLPPAWGDIPTWLAATAASIAGWIALSQLRGQQEVLRQDKADRRRAQATRIFIGRHASQGDGSARTLGTPATSPSTGHGSGITAVAPCPMSPTTSARSCPAKTFQVSMTSSPRMLAQTPFSRSAMRTTSSGSGSEAAFLRSSRIPRHLTVSKPGLGSFLHRKRMRGSGGAGGPRAHRWWWD